MSSFVEKTESQLDSFGIDTVYVYPPLFFLVWWGAFHFMLDEALLAIRVFFGLSVVWLPVILLYVFWDQWIKYVWSLFLTSQEYTLLEIRIPKEITKSPLAMELFLVSLYHPSGETTFIDRWWLGKLRATFSLEIASFGGDIHFYIRTRTSIKHMIESRFYAQYPEIELHEVDDYTKRVRYDPKTMGFWGIEYRFDKPDAYPIKTYVDFGLEKDPKEEHKVDPISHVLEFFGSIKDGEQMWIQFILRAHRKNYWRGFFFEKDDFEESVKHEIEKILLTVPVEEGRIADFRMLSERNKRIVEAIELKAGKLLFDVGIRALYFAPKERYNGANTSFGLHPLLRHLSGLDINTLRNTRGMGKFDYFWQDFFGVRKALERKRLFRFYQDRAYFWAPYSQKPVVLNVEEMATLFHPPGETVKSPTLERIPSRKAGAPPNLPV